MRAYTRDASWYRRPDVSAPKRYHLERVAGRLIAACSSRVLLVAETAADAAVVPAAQRCGHRACAALWATVEP